MAAEILNHVDAWFVAEVYRPLEREEARPAVARMWKSVDEYFRSGRRVCLMGAFAIDETRDRLAASIRRYFERWIEALDSALVRSGIDPALSSELAEDVVVGIQGALTLARAFNDQRIFARTLQRLEARIEKNFPRASAAV
jgi:TetR/AcrR family transcriptional repressor of lmrAB and yxaGH operons